MRWFERLQPEDAIMRPICLSCRHWMPRDNFPRVPGPQHVCALDKPLAGRAVVCTSHEREPGADDE
jgi:hypothetical protein